MRTVELAHPRHTEEWEVCDQAIRYLKGLGIPTTHIQEQVNVGTGIADIVVWNSPTQERVHRRRRTWRSAWGGYPQLEYKPMSGARLVIEGKNSSVVIDEPRCGALWQLERYLSALPYCRYGAITNGRCWRHFVKDTEEISEIEVDEFLRGVHATIVATV